MALIDIGKIKRYFSKQPIEKAWLFGSFARGEESEDSDVDILVAFDSGVGLFKYASIASDLGKILNKTVDLVSESALFPWVRENVDAEKILIYERETKR